MKSEKDSWGCQVIPILACVTSFFEKFRTTTGGCREKSQSWRLWKGQVESLKQWSNCFKVDSPNLNVFRSLFWGKIAQTQIRSWRFVDPQVDYWRLFDPQIDSWQTPWGPSGPSGTLTDTDTSGRGRAIQLTSAKLYPPRKEYFAYPTIVCDLQNILYHWFTVNSGTVKNIWP